MEFVCAVYDRRLKRHGARGSLRVEGWGALNRTFIQSVGAANTRPSVAC